MNIHGSIIALKQSVYDVSLRKLGMVLVGFSFLTLVSLTRVLGESDQLPAHLMPELHLFSMDDLIRVKKGQFCTTLRKKYMRF